MAKPAVRSLHNQGLSNPGWSNPDSSNPGSNQQAEGALVSEGVRQVALVVGGSLVVALCARITILLPFTPVPLTLQNFGVLLVGLMLGSKRGFAALVLYLAEGAVGMPVFSPAGLGGIAQLLHGATSGFLLSYPLMAWVAGFVMEHGRRSFARAAMASLLGELILFGGGLAWLAVLTHSIAQAFRWGLYWFLFAEIIKVMMAAGIAARWQRQSKNSGSKTAAGFWELKG